MSLVNYYYQFYEKLFWGDLKVTRAQDFFLVNSSWGLPFILVIQLTFVMFLGPKWMSTRKPFDLRPLLIVINGLHFGAYGCGILVIGYGISLGRDSWACTAKPSDDFRDDVMLRIAYALFCMRILELTTPVIMVLRGKSGQSPIANSSTMDSTS
ncbi:elongation of very long chain fatty acids protein 1-like [Panonychus citri]|uniref:elongation of very long chain fatty acids protein 1-like n=1 Tax=Panonychus citri TaxID=50023 RepID=UPI002306F065|nr:elongation of very long chain fatty acids protein 1-like [Panonychus citri]